MPELSSEAFHATMGDPIRRLNEDDEDWPGNRDAIGAALQHYLVHGGAFEHVHSPVRENVYLVVVIDHATEGIVGHHLLDLNALYGISGS